MKKRNETLALRKQFTRQFYSHNRWNLFAAIIATVLSAFANLTISWLLQQIIDAISGTPGPFSLLELTLICIAITVGILLVLVLEYYSRPRFIQKAMQQYKDFAFTQIAKKSIHSFSGENTATYVSALTNDVNSIESNYLSKIFSLVQQLIMFVGAFAMMLYYSPILTLAAFLLSLFPVIASVIAGNRLAVREKAVSDKNEGFLGMVKDMLTGFSVIKSFKAEREVMRLFSESNAIAEDAKCKRRKTEIILQTIGVLAGIVAQFGVFLIGAYLALQGRGITAGVVIVFVQLMNFVISPIAEVPQIFANRKASYALIDKLSAAVSTNIRREGKSVDNTLDTSIEVKNVSFGYEKGTPILEDISMCLDAGKSYAIVGGSGSGKSTLLNLLMGSREDYVGAIYYDGDELRSIGDDSLYDLVSIVQQNVFVFNSSILNNITMFRNFEEEKLNRAVTMSGITPLLKERGSDYACGENGSGLSGGERQRISIARSLLRGTPVMLVDEATAALDAETAFAVTNSILDLTGITRVIVTHRLEEALLRKYDRIFVLKNGRIAEQGTFSELMEQKDYFYSLYTVSQ